MTMLILTVLAIVAGFVFAWVGVTRMQLTTAFWSLAYFACSWALICELAPVLMPSDIPDKPFWRWLSWALTVAHAASCIVVWVFGGLLLTAAVAAWVNGWTLNNHGVTHAAGGHQYKRCLSFLMAGAMVVTFGFFLLPRFQQLESPLTKLVHAVQHHNAVEQTNSLSAGDDPYFNLLVEESLLDQATKDVWKNEVETRYTKTGAPGTLTVKKVKAVTYFCENDKGITAVIVDFDGELTDKGKTEPYNDIGVRLPYNWPEEETKEWAKNWTSLLIQKTIGKKPLPKLNPVTGSPGPANGLQAAPLFFKRIK